MKDQWEGQTLPKVSLLSTEGESLTLPDQIRGKWNILYFYPKDDTPGCTKQACGYGESLKKFKDVNVGVYGISMDDLDSHRKFQEKYSFTFPLLTDVDHKLSSHLGVYGTQAKGDKTYQGLSRDTFLINPEGKVVRVWRKVDPLQTVEETYKAVRELQTASAAT